MSHHPDLADTQPAHCSARVPARVETDTRPEWRTSSFTDRGNCVAVAEYDGGHVAVRNSNQPDAGTLLFSPAAMHAWIAGIKAGEFDDMT